MQRRLIAAAMLMAITGGLSGCAGRTGGSGQTKIGFLVKQPEEMWFQNEWKFADRCAEKYGFELKKIGVPDGEKVLAAIDNLAAQGVKGFVVCTPDVRLGPAIVSRASQSNMKVYAVDDQFIGSDGKPMTQVPYMGISASKIGGQVGDALWAEFKKRGWKLEETAACGITFDELPTARDRTDGTVKALVASGFPRNKIFLSAEKATTVPGANDAANIVLTQHPEVKRWLVFSMNDEGVMGAVRAMENLGFGADRVLGIGIGGSTCLVEFEKAKPTGFYATCLISPKRHGYETTENLYKWITKGTKPPMDVRTEGIIITRAEYKQVMKQQGLLD